MNDSKEKQVIRGTKDSTVQFKRLFSSKASEDKKVQG